MEPYTKKQYKEDFSLLQEFKSEFTQAVKDLLPLHIHYQKPHEKPVVHPTQMYYVNMDPTPFRYTINKDLVKDLHANVFISTDINPNGIDSTGRIGRTWDIDFDTHAVVRDYRCRRTHDITHHNFYGYAESSSEIIEKFLVWFSIYPAELKAKMIKIEKPPYETWVRFKKLSKEDQIKLILKDYLMEDVEEQRKFLLEDVPGGPLVDPVSLIIMEF